MAYSLGIYTQPGPSQKSNTLNMNSYDTGTIGGIIAMPYWKKEFSTGYTDDNGMPDITSSQSSMIVSILSAGTFFVRQVPSLILFDTNDNRAP